MPGKQRYIRSIDIPRAGAFDAGPDPAGGAGGTAVAPPAQAAIGAPTNLTLYTALERSAVSATANISAYWYPPAGVAPSSYVVQWSQTSTFPDGLTTGQEAPIENTTISGLTPGTLYYVRVAAFVVSQMSAWSTTVSITTAVDTTPPAPVTSLASAFIGGGDLFVSWANPTSANFRTVEIKIYESAAKVTTYAVIYDATQRVTWTVAQNLAAVGGSGDPSLFVEARALSWGGIFSTIVSTSATKAAPAAPTVTLTGGFSILVCQVTSAAESAFSLFEYVWKRDGVTQRTVETSQRSNTFEAGAAGDEGSHSWTCTVRQKDAFGQYSSATASSAVALDVLTIAFLRAGAFYSDIDGHNNASLAILKDDSYAVSIGYNA